MQCLEWKCERVKEIESERAWGEHWLFACRSFCCFCCCCCSLLDLGAVLENLLRDTYPLPRRLFALYCSCLSYCWAWVHTRCCAVSSPLEAQLGSSLYLPQLAWVAFVVAFAVAAVVVAFVAAPWETNDAVANPPHATLRTHRGIMNANGIRKSNKTKQKKSRMWNKPKVQKENKTNECKTTLRMQDTTCR